jgi:hypothetical protein
VNLQINSFYSWIFLTVAYLQDMVLHPFVAFDRAVRRLLSSIPTESGSHTPNYLLHYAALVRAHHLIPRASIWCSQTSSASISAAGHYSVRPRHGRPQLRPAVAYTGWAAEDCTPCTCVHANAESGLAEPWDHWVTPRTTAAYPSSTSTSFCRCKSWAARYLKSFIYT